MSDTLIALTDEAILEIVELFNNPQAPKIKCEECNGTGKLDIQDPDGYLCRCEGCEGYGYIQYAVRQDERIKQVKEMMAASVHANIWMSRWTNNSATVKALQEENLQHPLHLVQIPRGKWPVVNLPEGLIEVWRSRHYLVQVFSEKDGVERLSINIAGVDPDSKRWKDGISWDELQKIKYQVGRGGKDAVEIFPKEADIVNVANMRHLWVLPEPLPYAWRKAPQPTAEETK